VRGLSTQTFFETDEHEKTSAKTISSKIPKAALQEFFNSRECRQVKAQICDMG
jgi:hypothetical protein